MAKELVLINNVWVVRTVTPSTSTTVSYSYGPSVTVAEFGYVSNINVSSTTGSIA